jgi:hypothetical protein
MRDLLGNQSSPRKWIVSESTGYAHGLDRFHHLFPMVRAEAAKAHSSFQVCSLAGR